MKRIGIAIVLLVLIISCVAGTHYYLGHITGEMSKTLAEADRFSDTEDTAKAKAKLDDFMKLWEQNKHIMAIFLRHAELDPVNTTSIRLMPLLEHDEIGEFSADCRALETQLNHLWESERFTLDNIL